MEISLEERKRRSERMKANNPAKRQEIKDKISATLKAGAYISWNKGRKETREDVLERQSKSHIGKKYSEEHKIKMGAYDTGENAKHWKGDDIGYSQVHEWVRQRNGKATDRLCKCGKQAVHWANKDHLYRRNLDDYEAMCFGCHIRYDYANNNRRKKNENLPTISILIPTLGREDGLKKCLKSIKALSYPKKLIEIIVLEGDDSVPSKIKRGVAKAKNDWVVYAANDMIFHMNCIKHALISGKRLVSFNEGELLPDNGNICTHFMIKRDLIDEIGGEIFSTRMNHCGVDNLLWAKCEKLGEAHYCVDAKITHTHFSKGGQWDDVYAKGWSKVEEDRKILQEELALL